MPGPEHEQQEDPHFGKPDEHFGPSKLGDQLYGLEVAEHLQAEVLRVATETGVLPRIVTDNALRIGLDEMGKQGQVPHFQLSEDDAKRLKNLADAEGTTSSELIRDLIEREERRLVGGE